MIARIIHWFRTRRLSGVGPTEKMLNATLSILEQRGWTQYAPVGGPQNYTEKALMELWPLGD